MRQRISYPEVKKLWAGEFPELMRYTSSSLMMKSDIMLIGLWFGSRFGSYDIFLKVLPLWYEKSEDMDRNSVIIPLRGLVKGARFDLDYHFFEFEKLRLAIHELVDPLFKKEVRVTSLIDIIKKNWNKDKKFSYRNLIVNKDTFELLFAIAVFFKDTELKTLIDGELEKNIANCTDERFEYFYGKSIDAWLYEIGYRFGDRDKFLAKVKANAEMPEIAKLNESHLVRVPARELELRLQEYFHIGRFRFRKWWKE